MSALGGLDRRRLLLIGLIGAVSVALLVVLSGGAAALEAVAKANWALLGAAGARSTTAALPCAATAGSGCWLHWAIACLMFIRPASCWRGGSPVHCCRRVPATGCG